MNSRTDVLLIYPYFHREPGYRKLWLFPPTGLGYLAGVMQKNGIKIRILDGTFMKSDELIRQAKMLSPGIVGIYCMVTMRDEARGIARDLNTLPNKPFLVAGGPLPTSEPGMFLEEFDAIVLGEGEKTMLELVQGYLAGDDLSVIKGIALIKNGKIESTSRREYIDNIDSIPHPPA